MVADIFLKKLDKYRVFSTNKNNLKKKSKKSGQFPTLSVHCGNNKLPPSC